MLFEFGKYKIDVDISKTQKFYESADFVSESCSCDGCINYENAIRQFPEQILAFFNTLKVDIRKPREVYVNDSENNGKLLSYGGFYHLCGIVLGGDCAWISTSSNTSCWDDCNTFQVAQGYNVSFQTNCDLIEDNLPTPAIQLDISFHVPWVLPKDNTY